MRHLSGTVFTGGNSAELLVNGKSTFTAIFDAIERARDYVLVEFFIINNDQLGQELKRRLINCCRSGVRVYLLYDSIGSYSLPLGYRQDLIANGVRIRAFGSPGRFKNRFQLNFRNHRKIVVMDGKIAYVGGHNVGDEYLGEHQKFGAWRDTHVKIEGPAVQFIQFCFVEDWYWATKGIPELNWEPCGAENGRQDALVIASGPADRLETCGLMFVQAINQARKRIWIASPYFVPDLQILSALKLAALRCVDVRILLPDVCLRRFYNTSRIESNSFTARR